MKVRQYNSKDYEAVAALYKRTELYGGQFDENRDSKERLRKRIEADPDAILVAEHNGDVVGTVSLIEDFRIAWLFRFVVDQNEQEAKIATELCDRAVKILKSKGHNQVLVYTPLENKKLNSRYERLGFNKGSNYACYWKDI